MSHQVSQPWMRIGTALAAAALGLLALGLPTAAASGPMLVKDINPSGSSNPTQLTRIGNTLFFAADDGVHGVELWKTDGTTAGTKMVKNIRSSAKSSYPDYLTNFKGTLFFMADDGTHGQELWKSDGTKAGTVMVKDIHTGPKNQFGGNGTMLHQAPVVIGDRMFLVVDSCCVGTSDIYVSDGTSAGTIAVTTDLDYELNLPDPDVTLAHAYDGKLYFVNLGLKDIPCDDCESEYQLWVSDGTLGGTHRVAGTPGDELEMGILPASGKSLYFFANDRLWKTDGTAAGTKALTHAAQLESMPVEAAYMNDRLYFSTGAIDGAGLWKTDGTAAGTREILVGAADWLTVSHGRLDFVRNQALWSTGGSVSSSHRIASFGDQFPLALTDVGDKIVFAVPDWDSATWMLWKSDGTTARTSRVMSFAGASEREWRPLGAAVGDRFFFAADDGVHGAELWSYKP